MLTVNPVGFRLEFLHVQQARADVYRGCDIMSSKRSGCVFLTLVILTFFSSAHAAELRGRLTGMPNASVQVKCPGGGGSATIAASGSYAVRGLPGGQNCDFIVSGDGANSVAIAFSTSQSVTIYSGKLAKRGTRIVVIRK